MRLNSTRYIAPRRTGLVHAAVERGKSTGSLDNIATAIRLLWRRQIRRPDVQKKLIDLAERGRSRG